MCNQKLMYVKDMKDKKEVSARIKYKIEDNQLRTRFFSA